MQKREGERERWSVCVCVRERDRESVCVCVRERERERERERMVATLWRSISCFCGRKKNRRLKIDFSPMTFKKVNYSNNLWKIKLLCVSGPV
jgi:hypothetical protein